MRIPSGYIQQSPWLTIAHKQLELMAKYMVELGLTPASRSRLAIQMHTGPKPWEDQGYTQVTRVIVEAATPAGAGARRIEVRPGDIVLSADAQDL